MRNIKSTLAIVVLFILSSCEKKSETPDTIKKKKVIYEVRGGAEYLLGKKSKDNLIGVEYYKDYTEKDVVKVIVNKQEAILVEETLENYQLTQGVYTSKLLFKLPRVAVNGDVKIDISIDNKQDVIKGEGSLRIVEDYSLANVWNSLDKEYLNSRYFYINQTKNGIFTMVPLQFKDNQVNIGSYMTTLTDNDLYKNRPFIPGIPGLYILSYNGNVLEQISATNGEKSIDQNFIVTTFYDTLKSLYGTGTEQAGANNTKTTVFKSGGFQLTVTETAKDVKTTIVKI